MTEQPVCSADDCETIIPDDRVELVEGTGEWIETGEHDEESGLEITDWTGDWQTINVGDCAECQHQQEAFLAEFDPMNLGSRSHRGRTHFLRCSLTLVVTT